MEPCCKMRTQDCHFFRNFILELRLVKTTLECCWFGMFLFRGSRLTKIWAPFEIVTLFLQRSPMILICDSIAEWEMSGLTHCPHAATQSLLFYLVAFHLVMSAVLSCDLSKKVEPNNWGEEEQGCPGSKLSHIPWFQILDLRKCVVNVFNKLSQPSHLFARENWLNICKLFRIFHLSHTIMKDKILPKRKVNFGFFSPSDHDVSIIYYQIPPKTDADFEGQNKKVLSSRKMAPSCFQYYDTSSCWSWVWKKINHKIGIQSLSFFFLS